LKEASAYYCEHLDSKEDTLTVTSFHLAQSYLGQGEFKMAEEMFQGLVHKAPKEPSYEWDSRMHCNIAFCHYKQGHLKAANEAWKETQNVLKEGPEPNDIQEFAPKVSQAGFYQRQRRYHDASRLYEEFLPFLKWTFGH
jgi:Tfp pilus assembly protein PilF